MIPPKISHAFVLGAGLGTRLRPLTENFPKPLVPLWNRPLITFAFDHLIDSLGIENILVNTHHRPEAYHAAFLEKKYRAVPLTFRHEPTLLDTAGGIDNIRDWLPKKSKPFLVYNGDNLTNLPLTPLIDAHEKSNNLVTLALRKTGFSQNVVLDSESGQVLDMRDRLLGGKADATHIRCQFAGIYLMSPDFVDQFIQPGKIESVVEPFLKCIVETKQIGGAVIDDGLWFDLGNRAHYLDASATAFDDWPGENRIDPTAKIHPSAEIDSLSTIGPGAEIGANVSVERSIIWHDARAESGSEIVRSIIRNGQTATGKIIDTDL